MNAWNVLLSKTLKGVNSIGMKRAEKRTQPLQDGTFDYVPDAAGDRFTAGFGKAVLLPDDIDKRNYYIAGYRENNPAKGVIDPQYASAVWLDDSSGRGGVLFIALDVVGLLNKDVNTLKEKLSDFCRLTGCRSITVMSTHNHAGIDTMGLWGPLPFSGRNPKFINLVFEGAKKAAMEAYEDRRSGKLYCGRIEVPDLQEDIRTPEVYSKTLTRLRFLPDDGSREIYLLNFAAHCESLQGCNSLVSADYPCYLREKIKKETGAETLFAVGAVGGMISMKVENEDLLRKERRLLESTRRIGTRLGEYAIAISEETQLLPRINFIKQAFYVQTENPLLTVAGQIGILNVDRYAFAGEKPCTMIKTQMTYMEIDSLHILFLPCELFPELAYGGYLSAEDSATGKGAAVNPVPLTQIAQDDDLLIFGLSDDEIGYVLPPNDFLLHPEKPYLDKTVDRHGRRHYEETNSTGPMTAQTIADTFTKMLQTVQTAKNNAVKETDKQ